MVAHLCEYPTNHRLVHLKWVSCRLCGLHLKKTIVLKKGGELLGTLTWAHYTHSRDRAQGNEEYLERLCLQRSEVIKLR